MVSHIAATAAILWLTAVGLGTAEVCNDGEAGCLAEAAEDASLMQLRPEVQPHAHAQMRGGHLKCPKGNQPALLGELDGKGLKLDWSNYQPLDVPAGSSLTLLVCNIGNRKNQTRDSTQALANRRLQWEQLNGKCPGESSDSSLIQKDEEQAKEKQKETQKEKKQKEVAKERRMRSTRSDTSILYNLVPPAVLGPVGRGAVIQVVVKDSGNVEAGGDVNLHRAALVGPAVVSGAFHGVTLTVAVFNSGNIVAQRGTVTNAISILVNAGVETTDLQPFKEVDATVHWEGSGKVQAKDLVQASGFLAGTSLYAFSGDSWHPTLTKSKFRASFVEVGSFEGQNLFMVRLQNRVTALLSPLVDFSGSHAKGCDFNVLVSSTGYVHLTGDVIGHGYLLDAGLDLASSHSSTIEFTMLNSANLEARARFVEWTQEEPFQPFWINTVVRLDPNLTMPVASSDLDLKMTIANSANIKVNKLELEQAFVMFRGAIRKAVEISVPQPLDEDDVVPPLSGAKLAVTIDDSANWHGDLLISKQAGFALIEHSIDLNLPAVNTHVSISMTASANARGSTVCLRDELIDEPLEGKDFNHSTIVAVVSDSANVYANRFVMEAEDLVDEVVEVRNLLDTQVTLKVTSVGNAEADEVVIKDDGELVEIFLDANNLMAGTTVVLGITNCGNVKAKSLELKEDSWLFQDVMEGVFLTDVPVTITIASSANFQGQGQAVVDMKTESRLIRHVIDPQFYFREDIGEEFTPEHFGGVSIILTESANLQARTATVDSQSFLLGPIVDETKDDGDVDLSLLKSLSMFATAVANDNTQFLGGSRPCYRLDLPRFALPFAHSCVPEFEEEP